MPQSRVTVKITGFFFFVAFSLTFFLAAPEKSSAQEDAASTAEIEGLLVGGRYRAAVAPLEQALERAKREQDASAEATALHDLGVAYLGSDELDPAAEHLEAAVALAEKIGSGGLAASALDNLGTLHARRGDGAAAREAYGRAIGLAESDGASNLAFNGLTNQARLEIDEDRLAEAIALLDRARDHMASLPDDAEKTNTILLLGRLLARAGADEAGYAALSDARKRAEGEAQPRLEALATGYLGDLYADSGRDADAAVLYDQATFLAQAAEAPELVYRWQWQTGRLAAKAGDVDRAIDHYRTAVTALDRLRPTLLQAASSASDGIDLRTAYVELADLMLRRAAGSTSTAARQRDLEEARQTIERYRTTELTDYFQDECVTDLLARVEPVDHLAARTAVLYPIVMADRTAILLSLPDGLQQRSLPIGAEALTQDILEFRRLLEKRTTNQFLKPAQKLYDILLRPLEPTLARAGVDTLVIVPDEALRTVPLGALHDGKQFVIDRYALATVPSLRLLEPKPFAHLDLQPLLNGLSASVQGFPPLPHVAKELAAVEMLLGGDTLQNRAFVTDQVEQSMSGTPYSVVHIASHAQFTGDAKESFILTYDGRMDMDSLERFIKLSRFRDQPVELLTLSACQTAVGDDRAALGLAGLAVKSGARSALASLWYINDQASSLLIADFYRTLQAQPGIGKAKALQQAQIRTKTDLRYRHPAFWAPFLLIGNWL